MKSAPNDLIRTKQSRYRLPHHRQIHSSHPNKRLFVWLYSPRSVVAPEIIIGCVDQMCYKYRYRRSEIELDGRYPGLWVERIGVIGEDFFLSGIFTYQVTQ